MDTPKNTGSVGIGTFVKRQVRGSGKTYSTLTFEEIARCAEQRLINKNDMGSKFKFLIISKNKLHNENL